MSQLKKIHVLFDINHPAHFHLFKNLIHHFNTTGISYMITSRDKEMVNELLRHEGFPFVCVTEPAKTIPGMFWEMLKKNLAIYKMHKKQKFTHAIGTSPSAAQISLITDIQSYNFCEDDDAVIPLQALATYPFTTKIIIPDCLKYTMWVKKRINVPSFHELAYLHPENFKPSSTIIKSYGLRPQKYIVIRLSALKAHHDIGIEGITSKLLYQIKGICSAYSVVESHELRKHYSVQPWDMHHILAGAKMIISDSQTMSAEAMVMGVPSVRVNSFVGCHSIFDELEKNFCLGYGFLPSEDHKIIATIKSLLYNKNTVSEWKTKRALMLKRKINMHQWMVEYFHKEFHRT
jgi:uncharacterized protein